MTGISPVSPAGSPQSAAAMSLALARMASGQRITKAADDAAGLAISQGMTAQVNGLNQQAINDQYTYNADQTQAGYQQSNQDALQQMRTLAVQAGNDIYGVNGRSAIQAVENQLSAYLSNQAPANAMSVSVDVTSSGGAAQALNSLDSDIQDSSTSQATLGAQMNGLTHQIASETNTSLNLAASRSTIADADLAAESTDYARNAAIQQFSIAALNLYNQQQSNVLGLL